MPNLYPRSEELGNMIEGDMVASFYFYLPAMSVTC